MLAVLRVAATAMRAVRLRLPPTATARRPPPMRRQGVEPQPSAVRERTLSTSCRAVRVVLAARTEAKIEDKAMTTTDRLRALLARGCFFIEARDLALLMLRIAERRERRT